MIYTLALVVVLNPSAPKHVLTPQHNFSLPIQNRATILTLSLLWTSQMRYQNLIFTAHISLRIDINIRVMMDHFTMNEHCHRPATNRVVTSQSWRPVTMSTRWKPSMTLMGSSWRTPSCRHSHVQPISDLHQCSWTRVCRCIDVTAKEIKVQHQRRICKGTVGHRNVKMPPGPPPPPLSTAMNRKNDDDGDGVNAAYS